ncbi:MAG: hypothetical protein GY822_04645 [Deltaproteobacteria bacterium]|nr:hypothetical protein [Deltaproteobacteria bacterium]
MGSRILVCIEDVGIAHVVVARLAADGYEGVVIESPGLLVGVADEGCDAIAIQDSYLSGEAGAVLLRRIRTKKGSPTPAVMQVTGHLSKPDRNVLDRQYKVRAFVEKDVSAQELAEKLNQAASMGLVRNTPISAHFPQTSHDAPAVELHPEEKKNEFDIDLASGIVALNPDLDLNLALDADDLVLDDSEEEDETHEFDIAGITIERKLDLNGNLQALDIQSEFPPPGGELDFSLPDGPPGDLSPLAAETHDVGDFGEEAPTQAEIPAERPLDNSQAAENEFIDSFDGILDDNGSEEEPLLLFDPALSGDGAPVEDLPDGDNFNLSSLNDDADLNDEDLSNLANENTHEEPKSKAKADTDGPLSPEEAMQMNDLKKALLASKRKLENANKRISNLEDQQKSARNIGDDDKLPESGVFEELRYPALLSRCRFQAFTGALEMPQGGVSQTVFIKDGLPVGFSSSEPGERIGKMLVSQGRISDDDYVKAATRMVERGIKLSEALVELGLIDAEALSLELRNLTKDQIISGFASTQGKFSLRKGKLPDDSTPTFDFGPGEIYVQGFRQYAPLSELTALYETLRNQYLVANARLPGFRPKLGLTGDDERLLRLVGEAYTVEEAVERASLNETDAARLLAALQTLALIEEWSPGVEQFQNRLRQERQHFVEELAKIRDESSRREQRLFEGFERALAKIGATVGDPELSLSENLPPEVAELSPPPKSISDDDMAKTSTELPNAQGVDLVGEPPPDEPLTKTSLFDLEHLPCLSETLDGPGDAKFREGLGQALDEKLDEAESTLREAVRLDPARPEYLTSLARVLLNNPRYEREGTLPVVRSLLDRAVQLAPEGSDSSYLHAEAVREMGGS